MTRITLELDTLKCTIESQEDQDLSGVLEMIESALKGVGFVLDGQLDVVKKDE